jgi:DNA-binding transcriptional MerR regulator
MAHGMVIGTVAKLAGVKPGTIRYYEDVGLLPQPPRTEGNRRTYGISDIQRLKFIRHARELGFDLGAIRQFLALAGVPHEPCDQADAIARAHLAAVEGRISRLVALRNELNAMVEQGSHGSIAECRVIEVLANHEECLTDTH